MVRINDRIFRTIAPFAAEDQQAILKSAWESLKNNDFSENNRELEEETAVFSAAAIILEKRQGFNVKEWKKCQI